MSPKLQHASLLSLIIFSNIFLWPGSVCAQELREVRAEKVGMSSERLNSLDTLLQGFTRQKKAPGIIAFIARDGKIVYHKGFGIDDEKAGKPMSADAIFRIASQTKAIVSTAAMMLYEEGKFLLDDPVARYLPSFEHPKVLVEFNASDSSYSSRPAKRYVTVRDLLTHTSGIGYAVIGTKEANAIYARHNISSGLGTPERDLAAVIDTLGTLPLMFDPGEKYMYGLNSDVMGRLVEVWSGKTLDQFCRERIFEPLGMNDTYFYIPTEKQARLAALYSDQPTQQNVQVDSTINIFRGQANNTHSYPKAAGSFFSGGAGLSSTVLDYAIFLQAMLNGGIYNGQRVLSPTTVHMMTINQIGDLNEGKNKFGLGFGVATSAEEAKIGMTEGSFYWGGIFGSNYWVDPAQGLVCIVVTQKMGWAVGEIVDKFKVGVYSSIIERR